MITVVPPSKEALDRMVNRFLTWKLPADFCPDGGISFQKKFSVGTPYERNAEPVGTNLFTAQQARALILHILTED